VRQAQCALEVHGSNRGSWRDEGFFKRLLMGLQYEPQVIVTDKLRSYGVAQRQLLPGVEHRQSRYLNNRAENSHQPHATTRAADATIQIVSASPGLPLRPFTAISVPSDIN
jgi:transposase-like protein